MRQIELEHFYSIDNSQAFYVICPEGYVGALVSVEIAYAKAKNIKIIFSKTPSNLGLQVLADEYSPLEELKKVFKILK